MVQNMKLCLLPSLLHECSMWHLLHLTYKATDPLFLATHWLGVLSPRWHGEFGHCWRQVQNVQHFPEDSFLVNRSYKSEAQKAPQGLWAPARFLPLEPPFREWNMCHCPQPRLMQHEGLPFFKMLVLILTHLSQMITTFLPAESPNTTYTYQLIFL